MVLVHRKFASFDPVSVEFYHAVVTTGKIQEVAPVITQVAGSECPFSLPGKKTCPVLLFIVKVACRHMIAHNDQLPLYACPLGITINQDEGIAFFISDGDQWIPGKKIAGELHEGCGDCGFCRAIGIEDPAFGKVAPEGMACFNRNVFTGKEENSKLGKLRVRKTRFSEK